MQSNVLVKNIAECFGMCTCLVTFMVILKTVQDYIYSSYLYRLYNWCLHQAVDVISRIIKNKVVCCRIQVHAVIIFVRELTKTSTVLISCFALIAETDLHFLYKQSHSVSPQSYSVSARVKTGEMYLTKSKHS